MLPYVIKLCFSVNMETLLLLNIDFYELFKNYFYRCRTCRCLTPPSISCSETSCSELKFFPTGNSDCDPIYDEDGCCEIGFSCKPKSPDCSKRICASIGFIPPPNHSCKSVSDGCCQAGMECVENK